MKRLPVLLLLGFLLARCSIAEEGGANPFAAVDPGIGTERLKQIEATQEYQDLAALWVFLTGPLNRFARCHEYRLYHLEEPQEDEENVFVASIPPIKLEAFQKLLLMEFAKERTGKLGALAERGLLSPEDVWAIKGMFDEMAYAARRADEFRGCEMWLDREAERRHHLAMDLRTCWLRDLGDRFARNSARGKKTHEIQVQYLKLQRHAAVCFFKSLERARNRAGECKGYAEAVSSIAGAKAIERMVGTFRSGDAFTNQNGRRIRFAEGLAALGGRDEVSVMRELLGSDWSVSVDDRDADKPPTIRFPAREIAARFLRIFDQDGPAVKAPAPILLDSAEAVEILRDLIDHHAYDADGLLRAIKQHPSARFRPELERSLASVQKRKINMEWSIKEALAAFSEP